MYVISNPAAFYKLMVERDQYIRTMHSVLLTERNSKYCSRLQLKKMKDNYFANICCIRMYESVYKYFNPSYVPFPPYPSEKRLFTA